MISGPAFTEMALSLNGTEATKHFDRKGFRVSGRRMFATYLAGNNTANIFLSPQEQALFCRMAPAHIYPVPNKWGEKGATTFELSSVTKEVVLEALLSAYREVMNPKK